VRILFVAETSSIHTARWISQLDKSGWDIHVFQPTAPGYGVCEELKYGELHLPNPLGILSRAAHRLTGKVPALVSTLTGKGAAAVAEQSRVAQTYRTKALASLIKRLRPQVIHSLGLNVNWNNVCLPVLQARQTLGTIAFAGPWIYSSWGTDLDYYALQSAEHRAEVEAVLKTCDYYIAECQRDARLAQRMGFRGNFAGIFPAFGGVPWEDFARFRLRAASSSRRIILLKGRDDGDDGIYRGLTALKALALCGRALEDYRILIALASKAVVAEAAALASATNLRVEALPHLPYTGLLRIMGASRLFLSLTANDGLPSMLVEAMALGSLPVHSDLESIREWVKNGETGLLVPYDDPAAVADAIKRALTDDALVDRAAKSNARLVQENLSDGVVRPRVIEMYEHVAKQGRIGRRTDPHAHTST